MEADLPDITLKSHVMGSAQNEINARGGLPSSPGVSFV
ncbi:MAG: hypothetical protein ACI9KE_004710, partial [Polyangiales bacterium]